MKSQTEIRNDREEERKVVCNHTHTHTLRS